jgi:hypothetical protein
MRDRRSDQAVKTPVAVTGKPSINVPTGHPVGGGARFADSHLLAHDLRHHDPSFGDAGLSPMSRLTTHSPG